VSFRFRSPLRGPQTLANFGIGTLAAEQHEREPRNVSDNHQVREIDEQERQHAAIDRANTACEANRLRPNGGAYIPMLSFTAMIRPVHS
jgi:hypothetical protein